MSLRPRYLLPDDNNKTHHFWIILQFPLPRIGHPAEKASQGWNRLQCESHKRGVLRRKKIFWTRSDISLHTKMHIHREASNCLVPATCGTLYVRSLDVLGHVLENYQCWRKETISIDPMTKFVDATWGFRYLADKSNNFVFQSLVTSFAKLMQNYRKRYLVQCQYGMAVSIDS